ncbi:MAG TPA: 6-phosphofructokinase [Candidatus Sulfomarinibacteraceae bacterium]|nr:6-phosphofructokinase [Candidatus Sulfomarinibacteraceae bacterium]
MKRIGVLTSGGDAPGMNAAVRAVVRTALDQGIEVYAIYEGYQGMVDGGERIGPIFWNDVGGILQRGGTVIGSARCPEFRTRDGRLAAAHNLIQNQIEGIVVIGGDGSLTGADIFRREWPELVTELVDQDRISEELAVHHSHLAIAGLVGSIDNDMFGTDVTIGADSALHRITEAVDAISSTAASHQRSFVVEVMGRNCGYLALMSALATGADWVLIPEAPPRLDAWEDKMCEVLLRGRELGRRDSIVIVAEGAHDWHGNPISSQYVKEVMEEKLGGETRLTILGHVQRGGAPTAFDRNLATLLGAEAVRVLPTVGPDDPVPVIGIVGNRVAQTPLRTCLNNNEAVAEALAQRDYEKAMELRGKNFIDAFSTLRTLVRAEPHEADPEKRTLRLAIVNSGAPAPGMNTAVRAAVRLGIDHGHRVFGVYHGFQGLVDGGIEEFGWMSVNGWAIRGGAELGTNRKKPSGSDYYAIARNLEKYGIDALLMIGGWAGYEVALDLYRLRSQFPAFDIPIVCLPATIDNDLPATELSVGADTALNSIVDAVDKIKQSAVASRRVFVVEVMGGRCGYLALMSALATGAERVYLAEEGVTLQDLVEDVDQLVRGFRQGKRLGLMIRNELANPTYDTRFMTALFEQEGGDLFDVRQSILGHIQQGGNPTPFDRNLASRLAADCIDYLEAQIEEEEPQSSAVGLIGSSMSFTNFEDLPRLMDQKERRPRDQWWMMLRPTARLLAQPRPSSYNQLRPEPVSIA